MSFTLVVMPDGHAILTADEPLLTEEAEKITRLWERWKTDNALLVVPDCEVQVVRDIELDLGK